MTRKDINLLAEAYASVNNPDKFEKAVQSPQNSEHIHSDIINELRPAMLKAVKQGLTIQEFVKSLSDTHNIRVQNMDKQIIDAIMRDYDDLSKRLS
jgi:hypothetical protein